MTDTKLNATKRTIVGNRAKKIKRQGLIPAVMYSKGEVGENIQINLNEYTKLFKTLGDNRNITLVLDGKEYSVLIKDMNIDPIRMTPRHVDFTINN
jgi:large subunit ribosomal protein L25